MEVGPDIADLGARDATALVRDLDRDILSTVGHDDLDGVLRKVEVMGEAVFDRCPRRVLEHLEEHVV